MFTVEEIKSLILFCKENGVKHLQTNNLSFNFTDTPSPSIIPPPAEIPG